MLQGKYALQINCLQSHPQTLVHLVMNEYEYLHLHLPCVVEFGHILEK